MYPDSQGPVWFYGPDGMGLVDFYNEEAEDFSSLAREEAAALIGHLLGLESYLENDRG